MSQHTTIYLLDTNIISRMMRDGNSPPAQRCRSLLAQAADCRMVTSIVVQCELMYGLAKHPSARNQAGYDLQMAPLDVLALDTEVAAHYAHLRAHLEALGTPIGANDTLIAAHALALGATLVSGDAEFSRVPGLQIENWLQPA
ncbi:MAG: type II toxin-antitoxin system VapC family toxin [Rhodoferax sp.]|nr:type II toxin-antitoxin system VapC family toxin [Rhodoferax sp.]